MFAPTYFGVTYFAPTYFPPDAASSSSIVIGGYYGTAIDDGAAYPVEPKDAKLVN